MPADLDELRAEVQRVSLKLGRRLKFLVGKPGLDGHSNGAEQIAVRATDAGMDVVYDGIRLTPDEIVERAQGRAPTVVGLSILSGSHVAMTREVMAGMKQAGLAHIPVIVGGIIPPEDAENYRPKGSPRSTRRRISPSTGSWPTSSPRWRAGSRNDRRSYLRRFPSWPGLSGMTR